MVIQFLIPLTGFQAGLSSSKNMKQLFIALEPEAAAVYCRQRKLREFVEKKGEEIVKDSLVPIKTRYLVIDNGGKSSYFTFKTLILIRTKYSLSFISIG